MPIKYIIRNAIGYKNILKRLREGGKYLKGKWYDPEFERARERYYALANAILVYELDTDIFVENFDKWVLEQ